MLAVVKTPRTNIRIEGDVPKSLLTLLKKEYGKDLKVKEEEEYVNLFETDFYKNIEKNLTPGFTVRTYRQNIQMTQKELGKKVRVSRAFICDIEHERRCISKEMAKKFSALFKISVENFI